jgi:DsbC/DsbD-like thiol-disulfide interchange protein
MKRILLITVILCNFLLAIGQILTPVKWSYGSKRISSTEGVVFLKATIDDGWHLYSQTVPDGGPTKTTITFEPSKGYTLEGNTLEPKPITRVEKVFDGMTVSFFENSAIFQQKVKLKQTGPLTIKGNIEFMTCDDHECIPPAKVSFSVTI